MKSILLNFVRYSTLIAVSLGLGACAANYPSRTVAYTASALETPTQQPSDNELLNVRIEAFDPGQLPTDANASKGLSMDIRRAESYYVANQLKAAMQRSGHWGQVRVIPRGARDGEVTVRGKILESDGEILKLSVEVQDAAGVRWFSRTYESVVDAAAYARAEPGRSDAFQDMYHRIANDIAAYRKQIDQPTVDELRRVSELRFGSEFSPQTYGSHLRRNEQPAQRDDLLGRLTAAFARDPKPSERSPVYVADSLPAREDPIVQRVDRIRTRDDYLTDTLDQQYDELARTLASPYANWRTSRLREISAIRAADKAKNEQQAQAVAAGIFGVLLGAALASGNQGGNCPGCTAAGVGVAAASVVLATQAAVQASQQAGAEADLRRAALEELGNSLTTDVRATVVEVEGRTVELRGTVEEKMRAWREVLEALRESETGPTLPPAPATS
jgi:hypothetical protein